MARHLARQHLRFVVLEAGPEPGHIWRSRCFIIGVIVIMILR